MSTELEIRPVTAGDVDAISRLQKQAFGPGRYARSAYRVREGKGEFTPHCRVAVHDGALVAALRMTPVTIGGRDRALLLGPVAVDPAHMGKGYGTSLITSAIEDAAAAGFRIVVLVGDAPFYGRFMFKAIPPGQITLPGPVAPHRLLARELVDGALADYRGLVVAV